MACCGQQRAALRHMPPAPPSDPAPPPPSPRTVAAGPAATAPGTGVALKYVESGAIQLRGPVTGRQYRFSATHPILAVEQADAGPLLRTRFFIRAR